MLSLHSPFCFSKAKPLLQAEKELLIAIIASIFALLPTDALQCESGEKINAEVFNCHSLAGMCMKSALLFQFLKQTLLLKTMKKSEFSVANDSIVVHSALSPCEHDSLQPQCECMAS